MTHRAELAELAAFVERCDFPCTKDELITKAEDEDAPSEVMHLLNQLPDREFLSETDVIESV